MLPAAREALGRLEPHSERIELAGSLRRECAEVGDVEIVCIPRNRDLFAFKTAACTAR